MSIDWMAELASHFEKIRDQYPQDRHIILFDIDGTILDSRHMVLHVLQAFDEERGTSYFQRLQVSDIEVHENQVNRLLAELQIPKEDAKEVLDWYNQQRWSSQYIFYSHEPLVGVLEVIRWFQLQPNSFVGLNTGRPPATAQAPDPSDVGSGRR